LRKIYQQKTNFVYDRIYQKMKEYITIVTNNLKLELRRNENTNTLKGTSLILEDEKDIRKEQKMSYIRSFRKLYKIKEMSRDENTCLSTDF
jgi:hypothetical protein